MQNSRGADRKIVIKNGDDIGMKLFYLNRVEDVSGVSGTGIVAEGVIFSSGKCVISWKTKYKSITIYDSIEDVIHIHGHDGKTAIVYSV